MKGDESDSAAEDSPDESSEELREGEEKEGGEVAREAFWKPAPKSKISKKRGILASSSCPSSEYPLAERNFFNSEEKGEGEEEKGGGAGNMSEVFKAKGSKLESGSPKLIKPQGSLSVGSKQEGSSEISCITQKRRDDNLRRS